MPKQILKFSWPFQKTRTLIFAVQEVFLQTSCPFSLFQAKPIMYIVYASGFRDPHFQPLHCNA